MVLSRSVDWFGCLLYAVRRAERNWIRCRNWSVFNIETNAKHNFVPCHSRSRMKSRQQDGRPDENLSNQSGIQPEPTARLGCVLLRRTQLQIWNYIAVLERFHDIRTSMRTRKIPCQSVVSRLRRRKRIDATAILMKINSSRCCFAASRENLASLVNYLL